MSKNNIKIQTGKKIKRERSWDIRENLFYKFLVMSEKNKIFSTSKYLKSSCLLLCVKITNKQNLYESMELYFNFLYSLGNNSSICCSIWTDLNWECSGKSSTYKKVLIKSLWRPLILFYHAWPCKNVQCNHPEGKEALGCQAKLLLAATQVWHKVMPILCKNW